MKTRIILVTKFIGGLVVACGGEITPQNPAEPPASTPAATGSAEPVVASKAAVTELEPCLELYQCADSSKTCIYYWSKGDNGSHVCSNIGEVCARLNCSAGTSCYVRESSPPMVSCEKP
jgi:hypothetical protein